jgi:hypothetical protein
MTLLGQAALALAAEGFAVFPLRPKTNEPYGDDKLYRTVGGYKCATRDRSLVEFWWARHPDNNIGIATGSVSAIWVLDVDGDEGRETLATLEEQHGGLPETVTVVTPGKINKKTGLHTAKGYICISATRSAGTFATRKSARMCPASIGAGMAAMWRRRRASIPMAASTLGVSIPPTPSPTRPSG